MRESIGGAWLLGIVLVFMSIFIAFIAITINYSTAFRLKTEMVTIVEQYEGINTTSVSKLHGLLQSYGYRNTMVCKKGDHERVIGITDKHITINPNTRQSYCVTREKRSPGKDFETKYYYTVSVSFNFNLPVVGNIFNFVVSGETNAIIYPNDPNFVN